MAMKSVFTGLAVPLCLYVQVAMAIIPINGGLIAGTPVTINQSDGNQTDANVGGTYAAYTDSADQRITTGRHDPGRLGRQQRNDSCGVV